VTVTAGFRMLCVFVVLEVGTRRILHWNVTDHPTAECTARQFRMIVLREQAQRFLIHDRDRIYSEGVDRTLEAMGLTVLKTPRHVPQANAFCERVIGTIRRECVDFIIAISEEHVRAILREWVTHYNRGPTRVWDPAFRSVRSLDRWSVVRTAIRSRLVTGRREANPRRSASRIPS
jgi:putative transposase